MMKKSVALLLTLCLCCAMLPSFAQEAATEIVGLWKMVKYTAGDKTVENPEKAGSKKTIEFNGDGTAQVTINNSVYAAAWILEGDIIHLLYEDGDKGDFTVEPDQLVYKAGNQVQIFMKVEKEPTLWTWAKGFTNMESLFAVIGNPFTDRSLNIEVQSKTDSTGEPYVLIFDYEHSLTIVGKEFYPWYSYYETQEFDLQNPVFNLGSFSNMSFSPGRIGQLQHIWTAQECEQVKAFVVSSSEHPDQIVTKDREIPGGALFYFYDPILQVLAVVAYMHDSELSINVYPNTTTQSF